MATTKLPIHLTPRQIEVLRFIAQFRRRHHYSATIGEVAQALQLSRTTAFEHVEALRAKDLLTEPEIQPEGKRRPVRCLELTARAKRFLAQLQCSERQLQSSETTPANLPLEPNRLPLLGTVNAGYGIMAEQTDQEFSLAERFGPGELFILRVEGSSMVQAGIFDKDYLICRYAQTAVNGQLVVAELPDGKKTVKRFFKDQHAVRLQPANDSFEPIIAQDCRICAIVVGLIRKID